MGQSWEKHEGILLYAVPYLEKKRILKIFTPQAGLLSLMAREPVSPFCTAEWVVRKTQGELYALKDFSLVDPLLALRDRYDTLTAAGSMASDLLRTQMPEKPSQELYALLLAYLRQLPLAPLALAQSFRLKLLQFEGLLHLQGECVRCASAASHLAQGESLCQNCAPFTALPFSPLEWQSLLSLGLVRRFSALSPSFPASLATKIEQLLTERLRH